MTQVQGTVAPGFEDVRERFAASVEAESAQYGDPGAQLSVRVHGRPVVDLWSEGLPGDALTGVFSVAKGASHLTVALLVRDGVLSLDQPAWGLTLREVLGHRAGLIAADGGFTPEEVADDRLLAERLSRQKPFWTPGAAYGYHALTVAALTGAVVREATGRSLQDIYAERIRAPYGLELYLGLPEELEPRYREVLPFPEPLPPGDPESLMAKAFTPPQGGLDAFINTRAARAGGQGSAGGVGNARGVAGLYAAALTLLDEQTAAEFAACPAPARTWSPARRTTSGWASSGCRPSIRTWVTTRSGTAGRPVRWAGRTRRRASRTATCAAGWRGPRAAARRRTCRWARRSSRQREHSPAVRALPGTSVLDLNRQASAAEVGVEAAVGSENVQAGVERVPRGRSEIGAAENLS